MILDQPEWMGVAQHPSLPALNHPHRSGGFGGVVALGAVVFGLGFAAGATIRPTLMPQHSAAPAMNDRKPASSAAQGSPQSDTALAYPAEIIRVIDGDTFEARVRVWPGLDVSTKVRLCNIDAPELYARCAEEHDKAEAARAALQSILAAGGVMISRVRLDKYGGRVDALAATRNTADVSAALLNGGWARGYDGGRRGKWC